jgi:zinc transporter ZupT
MLLSLGFVFTLACIHIFASKLPLLHEIPRSKWLSFAGGTTVAYVFMLLLPELQEWQTGLEEQGALFKMIENHLYVVALGGLAFFYGLERAIITTKKEDSDSNKDTEGIFWWHIISFSVYNLLIGYLFFEKEQAEIRNQVFFFLGLSLHFMVNDYGLYSHHKNTYLKKGRWMMALAVIAGWLVSYFTDLTDLVLALIFAFLAGGIVLNTLKEELPDEKESNFWYFLLGAGLFAVLLIWA